LIDNQPYIIILLILFVKNKFRICFLLIFASKKHLKKHSKNNQKNKPKKYAHEINHKTSSRADE